HKRRLSSLGPGGLSRDSASMDARDVHRSHYGRLCPIESPEGANIGLVSQLACYARINPFGFIETPYRRVVSEVEAADPERLEGHVLRESVSVGGRSVPPGTPVDGPLARAICRELPGARLPVAARATDEVEYLDAEREALYTIAQANSALDGDGRFVEERVEARSAGDFVVVAPERCQYMDASPTQVVGTGASLIPFLAHDDANRALMAANMMRQAVPLLTPEAPLVGTGMEGPIARDSGQVVVARADGTVVSATAERVVVAETSTYAAGGGRAREYELAKWTPSNDGTLVSQRPAVLPGQPVSAGQVIADSPSTTKGELALGKNVLVAYLSWGGYNFEDGIVVSERLVRDDVYTSVHIEQFECAVRDTHLGPEELTREIPNASEESLRYLDEHGIARVGTKVVPGGILVGKVSPKGDAEDLAPEERLLKAILGERERGMRDTSMRAPVGVSGMVMSVRVLSRAGGDELPPNVTELVRVLVAKKHKLGVGDKMAGRHGNKGVVTTVVPVEDMPYTADGRPIDICLNPLGVPSRMNLGQLLETQLGHACEALGIEVATPVFDGATEADIREARRRAGLPEDGKLQLFDGRTGEPFDRRTTVGVKYVMKLHHLVEKKVHARSTGPYSLVTQQPLGGRAFGGGQRMGEMEVWALEAYGAANVLREMLTVKSDDVQGRLATYHAITHGLSLREGSTPESFKLLAKELAALGLSLEALDAHGQRIPLAAGGSDRELPQLEVNISRREQDLDEDARQWSTLRLG
ncbi:MAG: DNA-directed RNA polymerase subunit beta, partial [Chloroflexota bacterium]|nr:DNA-directed RNA polymerase subunit beta [Chloroflexota bacterium]